MTTARIVVAVLVAAGAQAMPRPTQVGPGVLSTGEPRSAFRGTFSPDGRELYFFRAVGEGEEYRIFRTSRSGDGWTGAVRVDLGGDYSDLYPALSADGTRLVFASYRPLPDDRANAKNAHLWMARRSGEGWGVPEPLARVNLAGHYHAWVHLDRDGHLYFRRVTPDWRNRQTLVADWNGSSYGAPRVVDAIERWTNWRPDVRIAGGVPGPGGRFFMLDVAATNPDTGEPASDIWVTCADAAGWREPVPLRGVNEGGFETFPFFEPDGVDVYFVRDFRAFYRLPLRDALPPGC